MRIFCDTNLLVASLVQTHIHHQAALAVMDRIFSGQDEGLISLHSLAETYAVVTRLPDGQRISPEAAWGLISENVLAHFTVVELGRDDYVNTLTSLSSGGVSGGQTYDAILLKAAEKSGAERILTFNVRHFQALAPPSLASRISAP